MLTLLNETPRGQISEVVMIIQAGVLRDVLADWLLMVQGWASVGVITEPAKEQSPSVERRLN